MNSKRAREQVVQVIPPCDGCDSEDGSTKADDRSDGETDIGWDDAIIEYLEEL